MSKKYSASINAPSPSMTYSPDKTVLRDKYDCLQFIRVIIVPPEPYRLIAYLQNFEFPLSKGVMDLPRDALPGLAMLSGFDKLPTVSCLVGPAPVETLPISFKVPRMLWYEPFDFVVSLYQQKTGSNHEYTLTWSEIVPCVLNEQLFPQPRSLNSNWIKGNDPDIPDLVRCLKPLDEIVKEKWIMKNMGHYCVTKASNNSIYVQLDVRTTTILDSQGKDTGEPLTFYQDRKYGLYSFVIVMDEAHANSIRHHQTTQ